MCIRDRAWGWLLGDGQARGIAAVFVIASVVGLAITLAALVSRPYRRLSDAYANAPVQPASGDSLGIAGVD